MIEFPRDALASVITHTTKMKMITRANAQLLAAALFPISALIVTEFILASSPSALLGFIALWAGWITIFTQVALHQVARIIASAAFLVVVQYIGFTTDARIMIVLKITCILDALGTIICLVDRATKD